MCQLAGPRPAFRKMVMNSDLKNEVKRQLTMQTPTSRVLSSLRVPNMNADLSPHDSND
jgi:hypothetical protein